MATPSELTEHDGPSNQGDDPHETGVSMKFHGNVSIEASYSGADRSGTFLLSQADAESPRPKSKSREMQQKFPSSVATRLACSFCQQNFSQLYDLDRHIVAVHYRGSHQLRARILACPWKGCNRTGRNGFGRIDAWIEHRRSFHLERDLPKEYNLSSPRHFSSKHSSTRPSNSSSKAKAKAIVHNTGRRLLSEKFGTNIAKSEPPSNQTPFFGLDAVHENSYAPTSKRDKMDDPQCDAEDVLENSSVDSTSTNASIEEESDVSDDDYSDFTDTSILETFGKDHEAVRFLSRWFHFVINQYMARLQATIGHDSCASYTSHPNAEGCAYSTGRAPSTSQNAQQNTSQGHYMRATTRKRSRADNGDLPDDDDTGFHRHSNLQTNPTVHLKPLLACFFHKRDPWRYCKETDNLYKSCRIGFKNLHRLKEHCFRVDRHTAPIHCTRCKEEFNSDEALEDHRDRQVPGCQVKPDKQFDGITEKQRKEFETKTRGLKTEGAKWKVMYEIIFPGETAPSPFNGISDDIVEFFEQYQEHDLPLLINTMPDARMEPLKSLLRIIVHDLIAKLDARLRHHSSALMQGPSFSSNQPSLFASPVEAREDGYNSTTLVMLDSRSSNQDTTISRGGSPKTPLDDFGVLPAADSLEGVVTLTPKASDTVTQSYHTQMPEARTSLFTCNAIYGANELNSVLGAKDKSNHDDERSDQGLPVPDFGDWSCLDNMSYDQGVTQLNKDFESWFEGMYSAGSFDFNAAPQSVDCEEETLVATHLAVE